MTMVIMMKLTVIMLIMRGDYEVQLREEEEDEEKEK